MTVLSFTFIRGKYLTNVVLLINSSQLVVATNPLCESESFDMMHLPSLKQMIHQINNNVPLN